jgi:hypothetical protein
MAEKYQISLTSKLSHLFFPGKGDFSRPGLTNLLSGAELIYVDISSSTLGRLDRTFFGRLAA